MECSEISQSTNGVFMKKVAFSFTEDFFSTYEVGGISGGSVPSFGDENAREVFGSRINVHYGVPDLVSFARNSTERTLLSLWRYESGAGSYDNAFFFFTEGHGVDSFRLEQHQIIDFCRVYARNLPEGETAFLTQVGAVVVVVLVTKAANGQLSASLHPLYSCGESADMIQAIVVPAYRPG